LIQVGVASLRRAKHTPRKTEKSKNENPKPSDAASHADPLSATAALTLSALLGFCSFLCRLYLAQGFFSLRFFFLSVKRIAMSTSILVSVSTHSVLLQNTAVTLS
jgi:hypothetical protein